MPIQPRSSSAVTYEDQISRIFEIISRLSNWDRQLLVNFITGLCQRNIDMSKELEKYTSQPKIGELERRYAEMVLKDLRNYAV